MRSAPSSAETECRSDGRGVEEEEVGGTVRCVQRREEDHGRSSRRRRGGAGRAIASEVKAKAEAFALPFSSSSSACHAPLQPRGEGSGPCSRDPRSAHMRPTATSPVHGAAVRDVQAGAEIAMGPTQRRRRREKRKLRPTLGDPSPPAQCSHSSHGLPLELRLLLLLLPLMIHAPHETTCPSTAPHWPTAVIAGKSVAALLPWGERRHPARRMPHWTEDDVRAVELTSRGQVAGAEQVRSAGLSGQEDEQGHPERPTPPAVSRGRADAETLSTPPMGRGAAWHVLAAQEVHLNSSCARQRSACQPPPPLRLPRSGRPIRYPPDALPRSDDLLLLLLLLP